MASYIKLSNFYITVNAGKLNITKTGSLLRYMSQNYKEHTFAGKELLTTIQGGGRAIQTQEHL